MKKTHILLLATLSMFGLASCDRHDDEHDPHDQEVITTVILKFTNVADASDAPVFTFRDPDGDGGNAPVTFDTVRLKPNTNYHLMLELKDESKNPAEDLTGEIKEEGHEHQFFYSSQPAGLVTVTYADADRDGNPIGIHSVVTTREQATTDNSSKFRLILRHTPNKTAAGVNQGNMTNAGGDTDVDINFPIVLK